MKSFNECYQELQDITGDTVATRLTIFKRHINDTDRQLMVYSNWPFLETTNTVDTVKAQTAYEIPTFIRKVTSVRVTVGTTNYLPKPIENPVFWDYLQSLNNSDSDVAQFYYVEGSKINIWPTPDTTGSTITVRGRKRTAEMTLADYTTGTITSITKGDETLVGSSTAWTEFIIGNWLRIGLTKGDYRWYEIGSITSNTELELVKPYAGTTIGSATDAYTIGEFSAMPGEFHNLLVYRPLAIYYTGLEDVAMANMYWKMYDGGVEAGLTDVVGGLLGNMIKEQREKVEGMQLNTLIADEPLLQDLAINNRSFTGESW